MNEDGMKKFNYYDSYSLEGLQNERENLKYDVESLLSVLDDKNLRSDEKSEYLGELSLIRQKLKYVEYLMENFNLGENASGKKI